MNTSVNLHKNIAQEISMLSEKTNISKSEIVQTMIYFIIENIDPEDVKNRLIEYQDKDIYFDENGEKKTVYERVHFVVDSNLANIIEKNRYKKRISISKLVCACFLFFWKFIVVKYLGNENSDAVIEYSRNYEHNHKKILEYYKKIFYYLIERLGIKEKRVLSTPS